MTVRTATPRLARAINDRVALDLLIAHGPLSAPRLRELTGLSRPTVSDLLDRLGEAGLVEAVGEEGADRRGPNAKIYGLVADHAHVAGVDVRHDAVTAVVADLTGKSVATARRALAPGAVLQKTIRQAAADAARRAGVTLADLHNLVIGAPGMVDPRTGGMAFPGWPAVPLPDLRELLGVPVVVENEVNLAAIAEHDKGAAAGHDDFALIWLDRGIGGAVVIGGRLRRGASGAAGELGRLPVNAADLPGVETCTGGFQDLAGLPAVLDLAARHGIPGDRPGEILDAAHASGAAAFFDELAERVAFGAAAAVVVFDPGLVVLAGETGRHGGGELARRVAERLTVISLVRTEVRPTALSDNPILAGAVRTALVSAHDEVFGGSGSWSAAADLS
ncbi:ROK family transcriptional regulator [Phytomonospora endophytica]|uniref:Putative NBD/HSP70 family sugar kinase n=1 Tax=Phytomonospora endophytica TaxID=714109 RepID=A0A841FTI1_9ACTN|nr:ROK family transcriptional regulator [Phytomonospora endophytica]MBB6038103.1 putative NBD/HSP70 family sugar kinase [Phytomonospora endophytica]GIG67434.1 transcriptional regulator [Phytomonospora endophytica]